MLYPVRVTPTTRALNYFFGFDGCALAAAVAGAIWNIVPWSGRGCPFCKAGCTGYCPPYLTTKFLLLVRVPPGVVATTSPVVAPLGTSAVR